MNDFNYSVNILEGVVKVLKDSNKEGFDSFCAYDLLTLVQSLEQVRNVIFSLSMRRFSAETIAIKEVLQDELKLDQAGLKRIAGVIGKKAVEVENEYLEEVKQEYKKFLDKAAKPEEKEKMVAEIKKTLEDIAAKEFDNLEKKGNKAH